MKLIQSHFVHENTLFELCYLQQHQQHQLQQQLELQQKEYEWQQRLKDELMEFNKVRGREYRTFHFDHDDYQFLPYFGTDFYLLSIVCLTAIVIILWLFRKVNEVICRHRIRKLLCKEDGEFFREQLEATAALLRESAAPVAINKSEYKESEDTTHGITIKNSEFQTNCNDLQGCEEKNIGNSSNTINSLTDSTFRKKKKKEKDSNHCVICFRPTPSNPMELLPCGHSSWCAHCLIELWNYTNNNTISKRRNRRNLLSSRNTRFQTEPIHCPLCRRRVLFICPDYNAQSRRTQTEKSEEINDNESKCTNHTNTSTEKKSNSDGRELSSLPRSEERNANVETLSEWTENCCCTSSSLLDTAVISNTTEHVNVQDSDDGDEEADNEDCKSSSSSNSEDQKQKMEEDITLLYEYNTRFAPLIDLQQTKKASKSFPWYERCIHMLKVIFDAHYLPVLIAFRITLSHLAMFTYLLLPKDFIPDYYGVSLSSSPLSATASQRTHQNYYYFYNTNCSENNIDSINNGDNKSIKHVCAYSQGMTDKFLTFATQQLPVTYKSQTADWHNHLLELFGVAFEIVVNNSDQIFLFVFMMVLIGHVLRRILLKDILSTLE